MSEGQVIAEQPDVSDAPARTFSRPPLFLHIGRGKSGSSTIQALISEYADFMTAMGVACPLSADGLSVHARLASALQTGKDLEALEKFRKDVRQNKRKKIFISAESLFNLKRARIRHLKRQVRDRELRLLCYIRDYPSWVQSIYGQRTKRTDNLEDFDGFFQSIRPRVSALPGLERWAEVCGWAAMHVRPLQPEALAAGDLVADTLHALGVNALAPDLEDRNVAVHWMVLEMQRALAAAAKERSIAFDARQAKEMRRLFIRCTEGVEPRRVQYITREQWKDLAELYRSDMAAVGKQVGVTFPINLTAPPERPFLPDFSAVSEAVKSDVLRDLGTARRLDPALIELIHEVFGPKTS